MVSIVNIASGVRARPKFAKEYSAAAESIICEVRKLIGREFEPLLANDFLALEPRQVGYLEHLLKLIEMSTYREARQPI